MAKLAPVRPAVLRWAMGEAGLDEERLSLLAGIDRQRVEAFLAPFDSTDYQMPNTGEFRKLAKALDRSTVSLLAPAPPEKKDRVASFRTPVGRDTAHKLLPAEQSALRSTARWQLIVGKLRQQMGESLPEVPVLRRNASAVEAASHIGEWLTWDIRAQRRASSSSAVLKMARDALEAQGVITLQFQLGTEACKGFSVPDEAAPAVALNSSYNAAARLYSVFHEAAHLVRGDRAVCGTTRDDALERWCESTAANLLMPRQHLIHYLTKKFDGQQIRTVDECRTVANHYNVSLRAAAVRLREANRASSTLWAEVDALSERNVPIPNPNAPKQTTPVIRRRELGGAIPGTLLKAEQNDLLSEFQVRRYLDVNGNQLKELAVTLRTSEAT